MDKFHELLGDIDSNDFEQVKNLLLALKAQKTNGVPPSAGLISTIDEGLPLSEVFSDQTICTPKQIGVKRGASSGKLTEVTVERKTEKVTDLSAKKVSGTEKISEKKCPETFISNSKTSPHIKMTEASHRVSRNPPSKTSHLSCTTATQSLSAFGFFKSAIKSNEQDRKKLFSSFVQDKRIAPARLRFWEDKKNSTETICQTHEEIVPPIEGSSEVVPVDPFLALREEDSSLLHPPLPCSSKMDPKTTLERHTIKMTFDELIETSNNFHLSHSDHTALTNQQITRNGSELPVIALPTLLRKCGCPFHAAHIPSYFADFDNEVLFCGFYSIGYDPFLARPPYFGTYNQFANENISEIELLRLARFHVGEEPPRFSTLDYEYDSGDDWDLLEGDEEIGSSVDEDEEEEMSLSSSDFDFINDNQEDSDSDDELQRNMIDARERRKKRLRGKDKLIPSFSGPFVGIFPHEHPLQQYDRLECFASPLEPATLSCSTVNTNYEEEKGGSKPQSKSDYFEAILREEVQLFHGSGNVNSTCQDMVPDDELETAMKQRLQDAALKNRREMAGDELEALHLAISLNNRASSKVLLEILRSQHLCVGVAQMEFKRTIKRFYEKKHGILVRREVPWEATDDRLFTSRVSTGEDTAGVMGWTETVAKPLTTESEENPHDVGKGSNEEEQQGKDGCSPIDSLVSCVLSQKSFNTASRAIPSVAEPLAEKIFLKPSTEKTFLKRSRSPDDSSLTEEKKIFDLSNTSAIESSSAMSYGHVS